jgi:hypothetical protein
MMSELLAWRPHSGLDYFLIYLLPGVVLVGIFVSVLLQERPSQFAKSLINALAGKEMSWLDQAKELAMYCLVFTCALVGWPGLIVFYFKNKKREAANKEWQERPDFDCAPEYLVSQVNPIDAEIASYVVDPLGAVPPLPFGHLNAGWVNFLSDMTDDTDEMWSFYIPKGGKTGKYQFETTSETRGYARVRDGKILAEFITERD